MQDLENLIKVANKDVITRLLKKIVGGTSGALEGIRSSLPFTEGKLLSNLPFFQRIPTATRLGIAQANNPEAIPYLQRSLAHLAEGNSNLDRQKTLNKIQDLAGSLYVKGQSKIAPNIVEAEKGSKLEQIISGAMEDLQRSGMREVGGMDRALLMEKIKKNLPFLLGAGAGAAGTLLGSTLNSKKINNDVSNQFAENNLEEDEMKTASKDYLEYEKKNRKKYKKLKGDTSSWTDYVKLLALPAILAGGVYGGSKLMSNSGVKKTLSNLFNKTASGKKKYLIECVARGNAKEYFEKNAGLGGIKKIFSVLTPSYHKAMRGLASGKLTPELASLVGSGKYKDVAEAMAKQTKHWEDVARLSKSNYITPLSYSQNYMKSTPFLKRLTPKQLQQLKGAGIAGAGIAGAGWAGNEIFNHDDPGIRLG